MRIKIKEFEDTSILFELGFVTKGKIYKATLFNDVKWAEIFDDNGNSMLLWEDEWIEIDDSNMEG